MSLIRTFVAVDVGQAVRDRASELIEKLRACDVKVTWTKPANIHLTLKFLGDTPDVEIPDVCRAVAAGARDLAPFSLHLQGANAFPRASSPRTVWIGTDDGTEPMVALQNGVDRQLHELGHPIDRRRFRPHLTIGRVRGGGPGRDELARLIEKYARFDAGTTQVTELLVFASNLERSGASYHVLGRAPLAG